jgi:mono/diheme cytochrome c family protein
MSRPGSLIALSAVTVLILILSGCSSGPAPSGTAATADPPGQNIGQLSAAGQTIFATKCSSCHGPDGQGGRAMAVTGPKASLGKYKTAAGLLSFLSSSMPLNAPGSLSHQEYLNVLGFLLVQNSEVPASSAIDESRLSSINLK